MIYMGSKARFAKDLAKIILRGRKPNQWYIEPFCGGCNMISEVTGNRIANDIHPELIAMWKALVNDDWEPGLYTKEEHATIRKTRSDYPPHVVGWVGFNCSYCGVYFGGFAGDYPETYRKSNGELPNFQLNKIRSIKKQIPKLKGVIFENKEYYNLDIPPESIIYCDPPYQNTSEYSHKGFDHSAFWEWCRTKSREGHSVYISEYSAPDDFVCIWEKTAVSTLSANGKQGGAKKSVEKLFAFREEYEKKYKPIINFF